jgi:hypothetical protein
MIFTRPRASPPIDGPLGHPQLHMQIETQLWGLVNTYCCSSYRVPDPFNSLGTFASSLISGPVFHRIDDYEHPLLYFPGTDIASQERAISGSCQQNLSGICNRNREILQAKYVILQEMIIYVEVQWRKSLFTLVCLCLSISIYIIYIHIHTHTHTHIHIQL